MGQPPQQIRVGRYVVQGQMGTGATGIVYHAFDEQLHRMVALKLLNASVAQTEQHRERLTREARAMAQLSHPNVAMVHEIGMHQGRLFIAMELLEGGTMGEWLPSARDWRDVVDKLLGVGRGLEAAHRHGLVHRDLKPDNILVGRDGRPRIVDFGLVGDHLSAAGPPVAQVDGHGPVASMTLTATGALLGTPAYMAPEQLMGQPATALSDQFAFCVTAYEALFGRRPFDAQSFVQHVHAVTTGQVVKPPAGRGVPKRVTKAILRGLAVDPQQRHPSMAELCETLEGALGPGRGARIAAVIGSLIFMGAVAGAAYAFWSSRQVPEPGLDAAAMEHEAEIRALAERGKHRECVERARELPPSYAMMTVAVPCAMRMGDYDAARQLCKRWKAADIRAPPDENCHPAVIAHTELVMAGRFEECLELALEQPPTALFLTHQLSCTQHGPAEAYKRACKQLRTKFPDHVRAQTCLERAKKFGR